MRIVAKRARRASLVIAGLGTVATWCAATTGKRRAQPFDNQWRRILLQSLAGQLPEMGRHMVDQFMRKDLALPAPLSAAGIGDAQDIAAGASAGQAPALFTVAEPVIAFPLQEGDEFRAADKPGPCRLRCSGHGGPSQRTEAKCEEPRHDAARLGLVMSLHVEALAVAFMDATRQRSKPIKLAEKRDEIVEASRIRRIGRSPRATARRCVASRTSGMLKARALPAIWKDRGGMPAGGAVL